MKTKKELNIKVKNIGGIIMTTFAASLVLVGLGMYGLWTKIGAIEKHGRSGETPVSEEALKEIGAEIEQIREEVGLVKNKLPPTPKSPKSPPTPQTPWPQKIEKTVIEQVSDLKVQLEEEISGLFKQMKENFDVEAAPAVTQKKFEELLRRVEKIETLSKAAAKTSEEIIKYDLKKLGFNIFGRNLFKKTDLKLDYKSAEITGEILNKVFKKQLKGTLPAGIANYEFPVKARDEDYTIKEWIETDDNQEDKNRDRKSFFDFKKPDGKTSLAGWPKDNAFDTANPQELTNDIDLRTKQSKPANSVKVALKTGGGKSTFLPRCTAFRRKSNGEIEALKKENKYKDEDFGVSLVFPYSSLVSEVKGNHDNWLSKDDTNISDEKKDKRVIKCPICDKRHTNYKTEHNSNGEGSMINVFTWYEFLDAYLNNPKLIKSWVIFDEAHTDFPAYRNLLEGLKTVKRDKRGFGMIEVSATFTDLPSSKKLAGKLADYYVTDFRKVPTFSKNPDVFKKRILVFCDDIKQIDFKPLQEAGIKTLILNDAMKDYAKAIVQSLEPPLLVFATRDYSVGFSFGDVNVISTGVSQRTIITDIKGTADKPGKAEERIIDLDSGIAYDDMMQIRGRASRDKSYSAVHMALDNKEGTFIGKLKDDYPGKIIERALKKPREKIDPKDKEELKKIINYFKKPQPIPDLDEKEGPLCLYRVLSLKLRESLTSNNFFTTRTIGKDKLKAGQFVFENKLAKYFDEKDLENLLIEVNRKQIVSFSKDYEWYKTLEDISDDFVFDTPEEAATVGLLLHMIEKYDDNTKKGSYEFKFEKGVTSKLTINFKPFVFSKYKGEVTVKEVKE